MKQLQVKRKILQKTFIQSTNSKINSFKIALNDFFTNSSIHGIRYINDRDYPVVARILWLIAIIISLVIGSFFIQIIHNKSYRNPILISLSSKESDTSEVCTDICCLLNIIKKNDSYLKLPTPSIIICPLVRLNQSIINITEITDMIVNKNMTPNLKPDWQTAVNGIAYMCKKNPVIRKAATADYSDPNIINYIESLSIRDPIEKCGNHEINNFTQSNCSEVIQRVVTRTGVCYVFNHLPARELFRENMYALGRICLCCFAVIFRNLF